MTVRARQVLVESEDLGSIGMNKLEVVRFAKCVKRMQQPEGEATSEDEDEEEETEGSDTEDSGGGGGDGEGGVEGAVDLTSHGWWRIDEKAHEHSGLDHAGRGWKADDSGRRRPAAFAESDDEELKETLNMLQNCSCCPGRVELCAALALAYGLSILLTLCYVRTLPELCPAAAAAVPPTPHPTRPLAGIEHHHIRLEGAGDGDEMMGWLSTAEVSKPCALVTEARLINVRCSGAGPRSGGRQHAQGSILPRRWGTAAHASCRRRAATGVRDAAGGSCLRQRRGPGSEAGRVRPGRRLACPCAAWLRCARRRSAGLADGLADCAGRAAGD